MSKTVFLCIFVIVKKIAAIFLLVLFLCANSELHQLLKLPTLVEHYLEHKEKNPSCSVFSFLKDHYSAQSNHDKNSDGEHHNLPFKTNDCTAGHTILALENNRSYTLRVVNSFPVKIKIVYQESDYSSATLNSIWQPPKTV